MTATFPEAFVLSILAAALFWLLATAVRWLVPLILVAAWLAPVSLATWALWVFDTVLAGDHAGVAAFLHVVSSIGMGSVLLLGIAALSGRLEVRAGHYGRMWWMVRHMHHHHGHW